MIPKSDISKFLLGRLKYVLILLACTIPDKEEVAGGCHFATNDIAVVAIRSGLGTINFNFLAC